MAMNPAYRFVFLVIVLLSFGAAGSQDRTPVCPRDTDGFAAMQKKVEARDPVAETELASCYDLGQHVKPNGQESIRWLTEAADQGYGPAQYELGRIYLYGRGVPADYAKALQWEQKAAEQGDPRAQRDLAFMYERGFGVKADPAQAAEWNRKAAAQGHPEAQTQLARALDEGDGVAKNPSEARQWYAKAASQHDPAAQLELARKLAAEPNCAEAIHWYKEAATNGQPVAMYELGGLYQSAKCGARKDHAFTWFTIGARFGSVESKAEAEKLEGTLTSAEKKQAHLNAEQWIKKHPGADEKEDEEEKR
ncbi:MAG TPA: tetratricopeptide repeat protein [Candidatus Angelobacter sp.]|nr:tetratricopeptide repeat protein [Candidatus Angelobacter sp.]